MGKQRLSSIAVRGMRTLEDVRLELDGFKGLIGENGSGKADGQRVGTQRRTGQGIHPEACAVTF